MQRQPARALAAHGEKVGPPLIRPKGQRQPTDSARLAVQHAAPAQVLSPRGRVRPLTGPPRQAFVQQAAPLRSWAVMEPPPSLLSASPAQSQGGPSALSVVAQPDACPLIGTSPAEWMTPAFEVEMAWPLPPPLGSLVPTQRTSPRPRPT